MILEVTLDMFQCINIYKWINGWTYGKD